MAEVTQPRVTCYRVGIRMDEPAMPTLLVAHRHPGFYLRVLEEGPVQGGEVTYHVEPLEPPPDGPVLVCSSRPTSELTLEL